MNEFLTQYWQWIIATIVIPIVSWIFGERRGKQLQREKTEAEVTAATIENITSNFKVYQDIINDLEARFKARIEELERDVKELKSINERLKDYIDTLKERLEEYEKDK